MKRIVVLLIAVVTALSMLSLSTFAAEENLLAADGWTCHNDAGEEVVGAGALVIDGGKVNLVDLQAQWLHLDKEVALEKNTDYVLKANVTLSAGGARVDLTFPVTAVAAAENNIRYADLQKNYGETAEITIEFNSGDNESVKIDFRNATGADADPWYVKAIGTLNSISLTKKGAEGGSQGGNDNPTTADLTAVFALVAVAAAGAVVLTKKR